jgi:cytochrome b561
MIFHWIIAALLVTNIALGLWFGEFMLRDDPLKGAVVQLHKSIGLTVLVLSILRLGWRLINPVPPLPLGLNSAIKFAARASHWLLYFLIVFIPLTGWLLVSSSPIGRPTIYFGLFDWPHLPFFHGLTRAQIRPYNETFTSAHVFLAWSAIVLIPIHVAAALYHHVLRGDDVFRRMWFGTDVSERT